MSVFDGFKFAIGRAFGELFLGFCVILTIAVFIALWDYLSRRK